MPPKLRNLVPVVLVRLTDRRVFAGYLGKPLAVGESVVVLRVDGRRLTTTPVQRVLGEPGSDLFIETDNHVYRLVLDDSHQPASATG